MSWEHCIKLNSHFSSSFTSLDLVLSDFVCVSLSLQVAAPNWKTLQCVTDLPELCNMEAAAATGIHVGKPSEQVRAVQRQENEKRCSPTPTLRHSSAALWLWYLPQGCWLCRDLLWELSLVIILKQAITADSPQCSKIARTRPQKSLPRQMRNRPPSPPEEPPYLVPNMFL